MTERQNNASYLAHFDVSPPSTSPLGGTPYLTSAFFADDEAGFVDQAQALRPVGFYSRYGNPTVRAFEDAVAHLEGAEAGLATPSGLGALAAVLLTLCRSGGRVVAQRALYAGSRSALEHVTRLAGCELVTFDSTDPADLARAVNAQADIVVLETPANPLLEITDLKAAAEICRARAVPCVVDNTVATPLNQQPLSLGCDLVIHSATKTMSGHGDATAGVVCGTRALIERIWQTTHVLGMTLDPFTAWLSIRGLRTLDLRVARQNATAMELATRLRAHPAVRHVFYPGLPDHTGHAVAARQMSGYGGLISIAPAGGSAQAAQAMQRFPKLRRSASFGGSATLVVRPEAMWSNLTSAAQVPALPSGLIRFGVGLEEVEDLWSWIDEGLR